MTHLWRKQRICKINIKDKNNKLNIIRLDSLKKQKNNKFRLEID